ncbi:MAG: hypothetical protein NWE76_07865, partial [Candidatus Bathyarchaeota archaeon]|nr:hypothetical protein [Candidatus Bathyarchaeota archaeon]
ILITISALVAMIFVKRGLKKSYSLQDVKPGESDVKGELSELRRALERADSGLTYSQLVVKERITKILLDRIRIENNLTLEEMRNLRRDTDKLKSLIDDEFLLDSINTFLNDINNWSETVKGKGDPEFLRKANELVKRMEV